MELKVYNTEGKQTEQTANLHPEIFGIEPNDHAIYLDVKLYLANQRQGTAKTKERSELSGSTRKLFRQKGTGGARRGDIKSPLLRGGARVFGPRSRDYSFKLNKKVRQLARKSALTYKAQNDAITVIDKLEMSNPKTKQFVNIINSFNYSDKKILLVLDESNKNVYLSTRNLKNIKLVSSLQLNTYEVMWANKIMITLDSLKQIEENYIK